MKSVIPPCLGPDPEVSQPGWTVPPGAWDTHFHVLGPTSQYPYAATRKYTPPDAPLDACLAMHNALGIDRGFVVHANTHGFDNRVDIDAVTGMRVTFAAFPWRWMKGDGCIIRLVAMLDPTGEFRIAQGTARAGTGRGGAG